MHQLRSKGGSAEGRFAECGCATVARLPLPVRRRGVLPTAVSGRHPRHGPRTAGHLPGAPARGGARHRLHPPGEPHAASCQLSIGGPATWAVWAVRAVAAIARWRAADAPGCPAAGCPGPPLQAAAQQGATAAPAADEDVDLHFAALVARDGCLYELDGRWAAGWGQRRPQVHRHAWGLQQELAAALAGTSPRLEPRFVRSPQLKLKPRFARRCRKAGPINHGPCGEGELLQAAARVVREKFIERASSIQFSLIALAAADGGSG